jgi:hypothetical protein
VFIPTTWVQIVNGTPEASSAPNPETDPEELSPTNLAAAEEGHSTCQHANCEFEGTHEEVRTHEENCDRRRVIEETPAEENERISTQDAT